MLFISIRTIPTDSSNTWSTTRLFLNDDIKEIVEFKNRYTYQICHTARRFVQCILVLILQIQGVCKILMHIFILFSTYAA
jgi:hypothetical protein